MVLFYSARCVLKLTTQKLLSISSMVAIAGCTTSLSALQVLVLMTGRLLPASLLMSYSLSTILFLCLQTMSACHLSLHDSVLCGRSPSSSLKPQVHSLVLISECFRLTVNYLLIAPECTFPELGDKAEAYKMAALLYAVPACLVIGCVGAGIHNVISQARRAGAGALWQQALSFLVLCSYWMWTVLLKYVPCSSPFCSYLYVCACSA